MALVNRIIHLKSLNSITKQYEKLTDVISNGIKQKLSRALQIDNHTFNELHSAGKQIVISSDKPPKNLETLDERFLSRFEWGLIADIQAPDYETRMAILRKNSEIFDKQIGDDIIQYIANNIKSNIRELEGALNKVIAFAKINKKELTLDIAKEALKDVIFPEKPREIVTFL